jgi:all-trans-retinol 13,14-reductase
MTVDVCVVGAGIGGLTTAALLAQQGARVVVCEQHNRAGGYCHAWPRVVRTAGKRFKVSFDAAVHDISGTAPDGPVRKILGQLGLDSSLDWHRVSHEYWVRGARHVVGDDVDSYIARLQQVFPRDAAGIRAFFTILRTSYDELHGHAARTGGLPRAPRNGAEMLALHRHCPVLSTLVGSRFIDIRDRYVQGADARQVVSILAPYVTDDVAALSFAGMLPLYGYYFRGGHYPRGGSQALADVLVGSIVANHGTVRLRTPVRGIAVRGGRAAGIVLADGSTLSSQIVISNADPAQTFRHLLHEGVTAESMDRRDAFKPSNSAFMVFLVLDTDPALAASTIVVEDDDGVIMSRPPFGNQRAPAGYSTLTLTGLVRSTDVDAWQRGGSAYKANKRAVGDRMLQIAAKPFPDLASHIVYREDASPATLQRYTWATNACAYGSTPGTRLRNHESGIDRLYLVGASTGLGPGIEAVMVGAASLVEVIPSPVPASLEHA